MTLDTELFVRQPNKRGWRQGEDQEERLLFCNQPYPWSRTNATFPWDVSADLLYDVQYFLSSLYGYFILTP